MNDRAAPLIAAAQTLGVTLLIAALGYLATHMPTGPDVPRVAPITSVTPTNPAAR